jgi:hypothetical protein
MLVSLLCFALAVATFFVVPAPWYYALPIAFAVFVATAAVRGLLWGIFGRTEAEVGTPRTAPIVRGDKTPASAWQSSFRTAIKYLMGGIGLTLAIWGIGFIYTAATASDAVWWDQGTMGAGVRQASGALQPGSAY